MLREDFGEGATSAWLRPSQVGAGLDPIRGISTSIEATAEGGGGRENVCCADVVAGSNLKSCMSFGVGVADSDCEIAATNARASLDSSRLKVLIVDSIHWGFSAG